MLGDGEEGAQLRDTGRARRAGLAGLGGALAALAVLAVLAGLTVLAVLAVLGTDSSLRSDGSILAISLITADCVTLWITSGSVES
ncbi:hypothetical protein GCM10010442_22880 [Kitasatospora kifunensis]